MKDHEVAFKVLDRFCVLSGASYVSVGMCGN